MSYKSVCHSNVRDCLELGHVLEPSFREFSYTAISNLVVVEPARSHSHQAAQLAVRHDNSGKQYLIGKACHLLVLITNVSPDIMLLFTQPFLADTGSLRALASSEAGHSTPDIFW